MIGSKLNRKVLALANKLLSLGGLRICRTGENTYDPKKYLLVEKNKFILCRREDIRCDIIDDSINDIETYNHLWGSKEFIDNYLDSQRMSFYEFVVEKVLATRNLSDALTAIDVGCGTGDFLVALRKRCDNIDLAGVDYSSTSVERCRKLLPGGSFRVCDIFQLDSISKRFDLVFCMEVLEHIQHPDKAIQNLKNICKPGGLVVITIPNGEVDDWIGHINFWNVTSFSALLVASELNLLNAILFGDYYMIFITQLD